MIELKVDINKKRMKIPITNNTINQFNNKLTKISKVDS